MNENEKAYYQRLEVEWQKRVDAREAKLNFREANLALEKEAFRQSQEEAEMPRIPEQPQPQVQILFS